MSDKKTTAETMWNATRAETVWNACRARVALPRLPGVLPQALLPSRRLGLLDSAGFWGFVCLSFVCVGFVSLAFTALFVGAVNVDAANDFPPAGGLPPAGAGAEAPPAEAGAETVFEEEPVAFEDLAAGVFVSVVNLIAFVVACYAVFKMAGAKELGLEDARRGVYAFSAFSGFLAADAALPVLLSVDVPVLSLLFGSLSSVSLLAAVVFFALSAKNV